ncbi:MAG: helix-turn-helix domain-containing protein [Acidobacteriaceae bacterium]
MRRIRKNCTPVSRCFVQSLAFIATLEPFVDAVAAGEFLGLHPVTVQRLAREGRLPGHSVSNGPRKHWRFLLSELREWLQTRQNALLRYGG